MQAGAIVSSSLGRQQVPGILHQNMQVVLHDHIQSYHLFSSFKDIGPITELDNDSTSSLLLPYNHSQTPYWR